MNDAVVTMMDYAEIARKMLSHPRNAGEWVDAERIDGQVIDSLLAGTCDVFERAIVDGSSRDEALIAAVAVAFQSGFELGKVAARKAD